MLSLDQNGRGLPGKARHKPKRRAANPPPEPLPHPPDAGEMLSACGGAVCVCGGGLRRQQPLCSVSTQCQLIQLKAQKALSSSMQPTDTALAAHPSTQSPSSTHSAGGVVHNSIGSDGEETIMEIHKFSTQESSMDGEMLDDEEEEELEDASNTRWIDGHIVLSISPVDSLNDEEDVEDSLEENAEGVEEDEQEEGEEEEEENPEDLEDGFGEALIDLDQLLTLDINEDVDDEEASWGAPECSPFRLVSVQSTSAASPSRRPVKVFREILEPTFTLEDNESGNCFKDRNFRRPGHQEYRDPSDSRKHAPTVEGQQPFDEKPVSIAEEGSKLPQRSSIAPPRPLTRAVSGRSTAKKDSTSAARPAAPALISTGIPTTRVAGSGKKTAKAPTLKSVTPSTEESPTTFGDTKPKSPRKPLSRSKSENTKTAQTEREKNLLKARKEFTARPTSVKLKTSASATTSAAATPSVPVPHSVNASEDKTITSPSDSAAPTLEVDKLPKLLISTKLTRPKFKVKKKQIEPAAVQEMKLPRDKTAKERKEPPTIVVKPTLAFRKRLDKLSEDTQRKLEEQTCENDYLTPLQRKDLEVKELRAQLADAYQIIEQRELEIEVCLHEKKKDTELAVESKLKTIHEIESELMNLQHDIDIRKMRRATSEQKIQNLTSMIDKMQKDMEKNEKRHQEMYLEMYQKGKSSVLFERQIEIEKIAVEKPEQVSVLELQEQLKKIEEELAHWRQVRLREHYADVKKPTTEEEVKLRFMRDSFFHYLVEQKKENTEEHLTALVNMFNYSSVQLTSIHKGLDFRKKQGKV